MRNVFVIPRRWYILFYGSLVVLLYSFAKDWLPLLLHLEKLRSQAEESSPSPPAVDLELLLLPVHEEVGCPRPVMANLWHSCQKWH